MHPHDGELVERARELDRADPLADAVHAFHRPADRRGRPVVYLDGNSLGPQPRSVAPLVARELRRWRDDLVDGWNARWWDLARELADTLAPVLGARPGQVMVGDSTTVDLHKLVGAVLDGSPGGDVVTHEGQFPTDRYVLDQWASRTGRRLRVVPVDELVGAVDDGTALVAVGHVDFRTGELVELADVGAAARAHGARLLADCSHSGGVLPLDLAGGPVDLAVGCTYKHLCGGPGAPAWYWADETLAAGLDTPLRGWFGHDDPFALDPRWRPATGLGGFAVGTPPVLSLTAALAGARLVAAAGIGAIRAKSLTLTALTVDLAEAWLVPLGFEIATPTDPDRRGAQVALRHPAAWPIVQMAQDHQAVVGDFRAPDLVRLGLSPLPLRHGDVVEAVRRLRDGVAAGVHHRYPTERSGVT